MLRVNEQLVQCIRVDEILVQYGLGELTASISQSIVLEMMKSQSSMFMGNEWVEQCIGEDEKLVQYVQG